MIPLSLNEITIECLEKLERDLLDADCRYTEYIHPDLEQMKKFNQQMIDIHNVQERINKMWGRLRK